MNKQIIAIACDHAGFDLKQFIILHLQDGYQIIDCGCDSSSISVDYPDFAEKLTDKIINKQADCGILICGTGIGVSIAANRFRKIRAALCYNQKTAKISRQHNDANVLCLGARIVQNDNALKMIKIFLNTKFDAGRHLKRVKKLS